jgi:hypothetical protein
MIRARRYVKSRPPWPQFRLSSAAPAFASGSLFWALVIPGLGQAQNGHYGKASVLGTAAWRRGRLFATQINMHAPSTNTRVKAHPLAYQTSSIGPNGLHRRHQ